MTTIIKFVCLGQDHLTEGEKNLRLIIQDILVPKYYRRERQVRVVTLIKMFKYGAMDDDDDDVRTKGYSTDLLDPTQVESKKCSQIQWPVPSINAEPVDIFLGEE